MEKKFNIQESYIVKLKQILDEQEQKISKKDEKFFNLGIIMDLGRFSQKYSYKCQKCTTNKNLLMNTATDMATKINTLEGRREITKNLDIVTTHLRKEHKLYIRRYISSMYTILLLSLGLFIGAVVGYFLGTFKIPILIGGGIGLFLGSLIGGIIEAVKKKNGQIYGKF